MSASMDSHQQVEHAPGPWRVQKFNDTKSWSIYCDAVPRSLASVRDEGNAHLIAAAPDHAAVAWAMCVGAARWEAWGDGRGEFCMNGLRHATKLNAFGVPEVTPGMRSAITAARGSQHGS